MAQTQVVTDEGIGELIKLWAESAATGMESIVCMTDSSACTAAVTHTYASPADTKCTDSGLDLAAIDTVSTTTVNTTGDTITFDHVFTATGTKNVTGILVCNNDDDVAYIECCFNSVIAAESGDTITIDGQSTIDQA